MAEIRAWIQHTWHHLICLATSLQDFRQGSFVPCLEMKLWSLSEQQPWNQCCISACCIPVCELQHEHKKCVTIIIGMSSRLTSLSGKWFRFYLPPHKVFINFEASSLETPIPWNRRWRNIWEEKVKNPKITNFIEHFQNLRRKFIAGNSNLKAI